MRAVCIELVRDTSCHSLLLSLIIFCNPKHMYSDNARLIIAGCKLIKEVFISNEFSEELEGLK